MDILYTGLLNDTTPIYMRELGEDDLQDALGIQHEVADALEDKNVLSALTAEEFLFIMHGGGIIIGVFVDDTLVAFRATLVPEIDDEHLGYDIGLETSDLTTVLYQEVSCVALNYRGHGLQKLMAKVLMEQVQASDYTYVCATVAPFNIPSLKDKFSQQMEVKALKNKYGGKLRYVFVKNLHNQVESQAYDAKQLILMGEITLQQKMLSDGWRGIELIEQSGEWFVRYVK